MNATPADPNAGLARIVVAAPMKSGSTYVSLALGTYFAVENPATDYDWAMEHALTSSYLDQLRGHSFCVNLHMLPHRINSEACRTEHIFCIVLWRNIADMLVSIDDHQFREGGSGPALFLFDDHHYKALGIDARLQYMIDSVTPWYVGFYLRWRRLQVPLRPFERMVDDPRGFFSEIMTADLRHEPALDRLDDTLALSAGPGQRLNVGRVGRSAEQMNDANKRRLEERLLTHPDVAQLEILLWELPWEVPALAARTPLDGQVVCTAADATPLFVSRGRAYPVTPAWLASRTGPRRTPRIVDDAELADIPRGELLA